MGAIIPAPLQLPNCSSEAKLPGDNMRRVVPTAKGSSQVPRALPRTPLNGPHWGRTLCSNRSGESNLGREGRELLSWPWF